jgi:hypothetical protein
VTDFSVDVVEYTGSGFNVLASDDRPVFTSPITRVLNGIGSTGLQMRFDSAVYEALCDKGDWPSRELRVFRGANTTPVFWGVPTRPAKAMGQGAVRTVQFSDLMWLFTRLYFGDANAGVQESRGFETTTLAGDPWHDHGGVATIVSGDDPGAVTGTKYVQLDGSGGDEYVYFDANVTGGFVGLWPIVTAWLYVDSALYDGPPAFHIGMRVSRYDGHNNGGVESLRQQTVVYQVDDHTPQDEWVRVEVGGGSDLWVGRNNAETIRVELWAVDGRIYWDSARLVIGDVFAAVHEDIGFFAGRMVEHAQDTAYGKVDLGIDNGATTASHKVPVMRFPMEEHPNIYNDGLMALVAMENGIDINVSRHPTSREFVTYSRAGSGMGKGADLTGEDFTPGGEWLLDWAFVGDANQGANSVFLAGDGDGPDREEGYSANPAAMGGRLYQALVAAPNGTRINQLNKRAVRARKARQYPVQLDLMLQPGVGVSPQITTGDRIHLPELDPMLPAGNFRTVDWALNPETDVVTVGVVPQIVGT